VKRFWKNINFFKSFEPS